ncbi:MAG TPA: CAP domain-containing protein, partial [Actinomycetota bacterium]|nr:CAP domain-containing protein [Actinomycetota bacterium]
MATAGAVTVVLTATTPALAASPAQSCFQSAVNGERAASGLAALSSDPTLVSIATSWSETLASQGILEHNPNLNA